MASRIPKLGRYKFIFLIYQPVGSAHTLLKKSKEPCVRGYENPGDPNPLIPFAQAALILGMGVRLLQSRLDILASRDYWVLWGKFLRTARRYCLIRNASL